ncbi:T9SS type A sorting domain-containing protein [Aquimarina aquimarini]|uniref:T9SS type A sorting domain-containing protein n=1 Tax=Aquimarina aquimarini TaxID=1191734 RepID=UPI001F2E78E1|nr:T9SS type A sorting domain-containing protein [Aquimarina aquimarini]
MKKIVWIIPFFTMMIGFAQQDYGFLVRTSINGNRHAHIHDISISTNTGGNILTGGVSSNTSNVGSVRFYYKTFNESFNTASVTIDNSWESIRDTKHCSGAKGFSYTKNQFNAIPENSFNKCLFSSSIYTIHIDAPVNEICPEQEITLKYGYHWQFKLDGLGWVDFPISKNGRVTTFSLLELFSLTNTPDSEWQNKKNIKFRTGFNGEFTNIINIAILNCSPTLDGPIVDIQPSCSNSINTNDNDNGSFRVTFDRALDDTKQEKMKLEVYKQIVGTTTFDGYESKILTKADFTGRSYTWEPKNLPSGTYKLFWQTKSNGEGFDDINIIPDVYDQSDPFIINVLPELSVIGTSTRVQCFGGNDGSITVAPLGGTPGVSPAPTYEYSINNGASWQEERLFDKLIKGNYTILIRDGNGCTVSSPVIAVEERFSSIPDVTGLQSLIKNPTRIAGNNGRIVITIAGGSGNYTTYNWTRNGIPFTPPVGSTNTSINDLYAGIYTIVVTDNNGCSSVLETFILEDPKPIAITMSMTPNKVACSDSKVSLIASAAGGFLTPTGAYSYLWSDGTTAATLSSVGIGIYKVTVTDNGGNKAEKSFEVQGPDPLLLTTTINQIQCPKSKDASIALSISGGTPFDLVDNPDGYTVVWTKLFDTSFTQSGATLSNLGAGFYEYKVTDQNNCEINNFGSPIEIEIPPAGVEVFEQLDKHIDNIIFGGATGVLEISVVNNTAPFTIQWFKDGVIYTPPTGSTDTRLINLPEGQYTLELTEGLCTVSLDQPIKITQPELLEIQSIDENDISCNRSADGSITVTVIGGVEPYTYHWTKQGDTGFSRPDDPTADNLTPGVYRVTITDDSGSTAEINSTGFNITEPNNLEIVQESITTVTCPQGADGAINISVVGGTAPYTFLWSNGQELEDLENLTVGEYTIVVADANNCIVEATIPITNQPNQFRIQQENSTDASTYGGTDGSIALIMDGGQQPYTFNWVRLSDTTTIGNANRIDNLIAGSYRVIITDNANCIIENTYEIVQPDIIDPTITLLVCNGDCTAGIALEVNHGNGDFTYLWNTGATTDTISNLCAGTYTVTVSGFENEDIVRTYEIEDPALVTVDLGEERFICLGQSTTLSNNIDDPSATYNWTATNGFTSDQAVVNVDQSGVYTLTITDSKGCVGSGSVIVNEVDAAINAEFLSASQVFTNEKFVVIDVTYPIPDHIEWILPEQATIVTQDQDLIELSFDKAGEYEITMITQLGDCKEAFTQEILVLEKETLDNHTEEDQELGNIEEFIVYPNPSDGKFFVKVALKKQKDINIKVFSLSNNSILAQKKQSGEKQYEIPFTIQVPSGVYAVVLETPYGTAIRKVVVE